MAAGDNRPGGRGPRDHRRHGGNRDEERQASIDTSGILLKQDDSSVLPPDLFDRVAQQAAKQVAENRRSNAPTQIRRFYDEVVMWDEKIQRDRERFSEYLPFLRMLNAKAAYAKGRGHVDDNFVRLVSHCLDQVSDQKTLRNFKLFFEAFMGFYKLERPKG